MIQNESALLIEPYIYSKNTQKLILRLRTSSVLSINIGHEQTNEDIYI